MSMLTRNFSRAWLRLGLRPAYRPAGQLFSTKRGSERHQAGSASRKPGKPNTEVSATDAGAIPHHLWSQQEIHRQLTSLYRHKPVTLSDKIMNNLMYGMYRGFNVITGYNPTNTSVKSMEWRLLILESVAGVPGFVAAGFRHFRSLRRLKADHGWIATLLEEAENERMHLYVCLEMFRASRPGHDDSLPDGNVPDQAWSHAPLRWVPGGDRYGSLNFSGLCLIRYRCTACLTYASVIAQVEQPGTPLHIGWAHLPAPDVAKAYWKLPADAKWVDALKCMFADECHHRDVNHTFAEMNPQDPNPFLLQLRQDALRHAMLQRAAEDGTRLEDVKSLEEKVARRE